MEIRWWGHSCFQLAESTGTVVVTDPFSGLGYEMPKLKADIVTISHSHEDHNNLKKIEGEYIAFNESSILEHMGVTVVGTKTFHDDVLGTDRGENIVYKIRMDGIDICHLGDIGEECNADIVSDLLPVDVLMIPVGGEDTINAEQAKAYVDALMPDIVIPMHYKTKDCKLDIDRLDSFLKLFEDEDILEMEGDILELDREDIDHETTKVIVMRKLD